MTARTSKLRGSILMTLRLLFHLYRVLINLQLGLCNIFLSFLGKVLDQVDSQDSL